MDPIQPVSQYTAAAQPTSIRRGTASEPAATPNGTASLNGAAATQVGLQTASSVSMTATSSTMSMVFSRVDGLLTSLGLDQQTSEMLRMIIALMILEALLAHDGGSQQSGGVGLLDGRGSAQGMLQSLMSLQSETNVVQIQHQSMTLSTSQAVQLIGQNGGDGDSSGSRLDARA